jgi:mono/diheme cytochrome c family protein
MRKPWYTYLYVKSPIVKVGLGIVAVLIALVVVIGLAYAEAPRMAAQAGNWDGRSIEKGAEIFANNCATCHGPNGQGAAGPALNSKHFFTERLHEVGFGGTLKNYVELTVAAGRPSKANTQWGVIMPTWGNRYGGPLRDDQVSYVASYILNWEKTAILQTPEEDPWKPFLDVPSAAGGAAPPATEGPRPPQQLFTASRPAGMGCSGCHMIDQAQTDSNRGAVAPNLGNLNETAATRVPGESAEEYVHESIVNPNAHVVDGYLPNIMLQDFATQMTEEEIGSLVKWLLDPNREQ